MKSVSLNAFPRERTGRIGVKKVRQAGRVPAVMYGRQTAPQNLEINIKDIEGLLHHSVSENLLVDLSVDGGQPARRLVLLQEVQHHPLNGEVLHVDLHEVAENEKVTITVAVEATGDPVGVKVGGGVLEHVLFKIKVAALPKDLPEIILVDVSNLDLDQTIHVGEIPVPEGVEILGDKTAPVFAIAASIAQAAEAEEMAAAPGAPVGQVEMIREKKEVKK